MAMTTCRECSHDVSDLARSCPHCGSPTATARGRVENGGRELLKLLLAMVVLGTLLAIFA